MNYYVVWNDGKKQRRKPFNTLDDACDFAFEHYGNVWTHGVQITEWLPPEKNKK